MKKMTNKKIKKTNLLINKLQPFVAKYIDLQYKYFINKYRINKKMAKITGIKDIQIYEFESGWGIGNESRTMELINDYELLEGKVDKEI